MGQRVNPKIVVYGLLIAGAAITFIVPQAITVPRLSAQTAPSELRLTGTIRDFQASHPDFDMPPSGGDGHCAGNVSLTLASGGTPAFVAGSTAVSDFGLSNQLLVSNEDFAVQATVLGAAMNGRAITRVRVGTDVFEPFGPFAQAVAGNVNDDQTATGWANPGSNPRVEALRGVFPAGTPVTVEGRSWNKTSGSGLQDSNWQPRITVNTADNSPQVKVLLDGDPVPKVDGFANQASIEDYVSDYVDFTTRTMTLGPHQAIYCFELTMTTSLSTRDFQDLVVLVSLAETPSYFDDGTIGGGAGSTAAGYDVLSEWSDSVGSPIAPHLVSPAAAGNTDACGFALADLEGVAGAATDGGITSTDRFDEWFNDRLGTNLSISHGITLVNVGKRYEYVDYDFHPIDGRLFDNEGEPHNHNFTYMIPAIFTYDECARQHVEFMGGDGAWLFIDGQLVIDLGGVGSATSQYILLDRLGLTDGQEYMLHLFYAQRTPASSTFVLRTNIELTPPALFSSVSAAFD